VRLVERRPIPPLGHFSLIRFSKCPDDTEKGRAMSAAGPAGAPIGAAG
jgi:hypothetical protein